MPTPPLRSLLSGGDRRSIAQAGRVLRRIRRRPSEIAAVAALAGDSDVLVSMRAMDVLEKLAHEHPDWVQPHRALFIGPLARSDRWEIRLQIVRALPLVSWSPRERARAIAVLRDNVDHPQLFVRAWAVDSLARFARQDPRLRPEVRRHLAAFERSDRKALSTRARHIRARLAAR